MKIIFSRKGADSTTYKDKNTGERVHQNLGIPSPIIDGEMFSLPIPDNSDHNCKKKYSDLRVKLHGELFDLKRFLEKNNRGKYFDYSVHADPDLDIEMIERKCVSGYRGSIGQADKSYSHLTNRVGEGDLFIFFGWFDEYSKSEFKRIGSNRMQIFGWLQIGTLEPVDSLEKIGSIREKYPALAEHPHLNYPENVNFKRPEGLYIAKEGKLFTKGEFERLDELAKESYGLFKKYDKSRCLTIRGENGKLRARSFCKLPRYMQGNLTNRGDNEWKEYHEDGFSEVSFQRTGQEFIFDTEKIDSQKKELLDNFLVDIFSK